MRHILTGVISYLSRFYDWQHKFPVHLHVEYWVPRLGWTNKQGIQKYGFHYTAISVMIVFTKRDY